MRRREWVVEDTGRLTPPDWTQSFVAGFQHVGGFHLAELRAARLAWCRENGCYEQGGCQVPCDDRASTR